MERPRPTPEQVRSSLEGLARGVELRIGLDDGREVIGHFARVQDDRLILEDVDADQIHAGEESGLSIQDVNDVVILISTDGPE